MQFSVNFFLKFSLGFLIVGFQHGFPGKVSQFSSFSFCFLSFFERVISLLFRGLDLLKVVKSTRPNFRGA